MQNGHLKMYNCPPHIHRLDLQLPQNATCQCTLCRKFTGALLPQAISIPTSYISPPLPSNRTYKSYHSSSFAYRSFCSNCGSSLAFNYNGRPETTEIHLGSLDEEVLCGKKVSQAEDGKVTKRDGSTLGYDLCKARDHIWVENAIRGITDKLEGSLYAKGRGE
jgi:hypothetical protein